LVRAVAAVDQAGFLERGFCAGPAGLCPEIGVDGALPGGERRQQDPGLVFTEGGSPRSVAQGAALRLGEDIEAGCDGPGFGWDPPQRQRPAEIRVVLGGGDRGRGAAAAIAGRGRAGPR
jgi:hypothetical protein